MLKMQEVADLAGNIMLKYTETGRIRNVRVIIEMVKGHPKVISFKFGKELRTAGVVIPGSVTDRLFHENMTEEDPDGLFLMPGSFKDSQKRNVIQRLIQDIVPFELDMTARGKHYKLRREGFEYVGNY